MTAEYSIQKMVSDGTLSTIALGIQYLQRNDIYMRIAGEETPQSGAPSGYTWSFINNTALKILPVVPAGVEVVVYRRTDLDEMYNIYSQNAQFDESTIDENNQQLLYIAQEYFEQGVPAQLIDGVEYVREDTVNMYYRLKLSDGSYTAEFPVPKGGAAGFEALRRSYAEAGFTMVAGSFEEGGTLTSSSDALLHKATGIAYSWDGVFPQVVAASSTPTPIGAGGWIDRSDVLLRNALAGGVGASLIGTGAGRTQEDKNAEIVSITDKGAEPGIDCTAAIVEALTATTGTVYVPPGDFVATPSVASVHSVLPLLGRVHTDGNITINIPDGVATGTAPAVGDISGSGSIKVVGSAATTLRSITGFVSATGVAGAWDVTIQMDSVAGMAVGGFIHTTDVTGTAAAAIHRGCWPVLSINAGANQVTVRNNCWQSVFPMHTITGSVTHPINAVIKFNNCDGFYQRSGQLFIDNLIIRGNASDYWLSSNVSGTEKGTHGIYVGGPTVALNGKTDNVNQYGLSGASISAGPMVGVYDFDQQGVVTELGGWVFGDFLASCFNRRRGFYASTASGIRAKHISACGNYLDGVITDIGGNIYSSSSSCAAGNRQRGISSAQGGTILFDSGILVSNVSDGAAAVAGGIVQATNAMVSQNTGHGFFAEYNSTVYCNNSTIDSNGGNGLYGSVGSIFRATNSLITNNSLFGVRSDLGSDINYQGSTVSGNASGEVSLGSDSKVLKATRFGGTLYGDKVNIRTFSTGNGVQLAATSGGEAFIFGYDTAAANSYTKAYTLASNSNGFYPESDGVNNIGRASNRWNTVYASTGTINTSDAREKSKPEPIDDRVLDAWGDVQLITFQWLSSVSIKGSDLARWHFGVIAQQVRDAFASHGIDGTKYGLLCYDEWNDEFEINEDGNSVQTKAAGDRWGIRPDQCLFIEAAYQRRRCDRIEARLNASGL